MGKCFGRCYWVQYETKYPESSSISIEFRGPLSIPEHLMPTPKDLTDLINKLMKQYNRRGTRVRVGECLEGCDCEPQQLPDAPWTGWKKVPFRRMLVKAKGEEKIEYAVQGELEIRKRLMEGVCLEREL